jgi:SAM-dependent methyltransferase
MAAETKLNGRERAADIAAVAALLEIADRLGVLSVIDSGKPFRIDDLSKSGNVPADGAATFVKALNAASIIQPSGEPDTFETVADFAQLRYESGYLSWALNANRPFIENAAWFLNAPHEARKVHQRDGRQVAVSSQWVGSKGFYPAALSSILDIKPQHAVDLGAGTGRLLIEILLALPASTAVALDMDAPSCVEAGRAAERAGVADRLTVVERPIQSLATDPSPLEDADVIHAGFVFHDMFPEEEHIADAVLRNCRDALKPNAIMAITDAVPYPEDERERRFGTLITYYHHQFMGRRLLTEDEWTDKLRGAGFRSVRSIVHQLAGARLFVATK